MLPVLQIGSLALPVPGLALLIGVWVALSMAEREAARLGLDPEAVYRLAAIGLVAGLIGARLAYVAHAPSAYAMDPLGVFSLNTIALAPTDGMLIGTAAAVVYGLRQRLPFRATLDALTPGLAAMAVAVAVAHVASGDAFGAPAQVPWRVYLWGEYRHPSQVYELIAAFGVMGLAWRARARPLPAGFNFLLVVASSAAARVFLETFRGDSILIPGGWRAAQLWALMVLAACLVAMRYWSQGTAPRQYEVAGPVK